MIYHPYDFYWEKSAAFFMIILTLIIYQIYKRYKNRREVNKPYSFLTINEKLNSQRLNVLSLLNFYEISLIIKDSLNYFIEMKIQFYLKTSELDQKSLFLDYFNFGKIFNFSLNGKEFCPKILHGRIYFKKDFLKF